MNLVKLLLKEILVYWHLLSHVPKGVLERVRRKCFSFLWKGKLDHGGYHLETW
jgi:hypothetical protein